MSMASFRARGSFLPSLALAGLVAGAACSIVSSDITTITFDMPSKSYTFDTSSSTWKAPPGTYPAITCGAGGLVADCCQGLSGAPGIDCSTLVCEQGVCTVELAIDVVQSVNLKNEVPSLMGLNSQSLADIYISQLHYTVMSSLDVAMPPVDLYLAPDGVTSAKDSAAAKFGTIPSSPAMQDSAGDVMLDANSQTVFSQYAHQFGTPFNFIAHVAIQVPPGTPAPTGKATITVTGKISAKPSL